MSCRKPPLCAVFHWPIQLNQYFDRHRMSNVTAIEINEAIITPIYSSASAYMKSAWRCFNAAIEKVMSVLVAWRESLCKSKLDKWLYVVRRGGRRGILIFRAYIFGIFLNESGRSEITHSSAVNFWLCLSAPSQRYKCPSKHQALSMWWLYSSVSREAVTS